MHMHGNLYWSYLTRESIRGLQLVVPLECCTQKNIVLRLYVHLKPYSSYLASMPFLKPYICLQKVILIPLYMILFYLLSLSE